MSYFQNKKLTLFLAIIVLLVVINSDRLLGLFQTPETIEIEGKTFKLEIADEPEELTQGLSGREKLAQDYGLLFVFPKPGRHGFWMKDMKFPIDIIWLNENREVIGITKNLEPSSYPQVFYPPSEIKYALEINTGIIK